MRKKLITLLTITGGFWLTDSALAQQFDWPRAAPQSPVQSEPVAINSGGFIGDTKFSESAEARSMSPAHWGTDKPYWPTASADKGPGCETDLNQRVSPATSPASSASGSRFQFPAQPGSQSGSTNNTYVPRLPGGLPTLQPWPSRIDDGKQPSPASRSYYQPGADSSGPENSTGRYPLPAKQTSAVKGAVQQDDSQPLLGPPMIDPQQELPLSVLENGMPDDRLPGIPRPEGVIIPGENPQRQTAPGPWQLPQATNSGQQSGLTNGANPVTCEDWERGFRQSTLTVRPQVWDDGEPYDFENKKKHYPPMKEILATGRYFSMAEWQALKPYFLNNAAITVSSLTSAHSIQHDFDFEAAPRFRAGFESKYGPGIELQYSQFDHLSDRTGFVSDGFNQGSTSVWMTSPAQQITLGTSNAGERLVAEHDLETHSLMASFFKEVKLPISRVNGTFGIRYVSVAQNMTAGLFDTSGNQIGSLLHKTDLRVAGPNLGLEYYRPVGHTPFELIGAFNGSMLFGNRDQYVQTDSLSFNNIGSNEFMTILDFYAGLQYVKNTAERRSWYARLGFTHQVWLGGGTATDPQGDFGLRGVGFAFGFNR